MTRPTIHIHLYGDGSHSLRTQGLDAFDVYLVRNCIRKERNPDRLRALVEEHTGITPTVTVARVVADPPSGPLVCGEEE